MNWHETAPGEYTMRRGEDRLTVYRHDDGWRFTVEIGELATFATRTGYPKPETARVLAEHVYSELATVPL